MKIYPITRSTVESSPTIVSMSPKVFSGRPVIDGTGISTGIIADRFNAGDSIETLVKDYRQPAETIQEAIRCELKKAA